MAGGAGQFMRHAPRHKYFCNERPARNAISAGALSMMTSVDNFFLGNITGPVDDGPIAIASKCWSGVLGRLDVNDGKKTTPCRCLSPSNCKGPLRGNQG